MTATRKAPYQGSPKEKPWSVAVTITGRRATVATSGPVPDTGFLVTFGEYDGTRALMLQPFTKGTMEAIAGADLTTIQWIGPTAGQAPGQADE